MAAELLNKQVQYRDFFGKKILMRYCTFKFFCIFSSGFCWQCSHIENLLCTDSFGGGGGIPGPGQMGGKKSGELEEGNMVEKEGIIYFGRGILAHDSAGNTHTHKQDFQGSTLDPFSLGISSSPQFHLKVLLALSLNIESIGLHACRKRNMGQPLSWNPRFLLGDKWCPGS